MMVINNEDQISKHYDDMSHVYRPSHADATYDAKYGIRAVAGGGRASARETVARVAAGAIAKRILDMYSGVNIVGYVKQVHDVVAGGIDLETVSHEQVSSYPTITISHVYFFCYDYSASCFADRWKRA
jgi:chorismate synthase